MQGKWHAFFKNNHPITLELACGKGEYTVGLGRMYANRNFVGVDIKGNRIWSAATITEKLELKNIDLEIKQGEFFSYISPDFTRTRPDE